MKNTFEDDNGKVWEVECEILNVCDENGCYNLIEFPDKTIFVFDDNKENRKRLFDYLRENYKK